MLVTKQPPKRGPEDPLKEATAIQRHHFRVPEAVLSFKDKHDVHITVEVVEF